MSSLGLFLQSMDHFEDIGPSVVMASPGMMQSGLSRELFENWCTDKRNGVIIAGYCVEGTLAKVRERTGELWPSGLFSVLHTIKSLIQVAPNPQT